MAKQVPKLTEKDRQEMAEEKRRNFEERLAVRVNGQLLWTSELELQGAFKLSLGSEKDLEDARHLYGILKERLDRTLLEQHIRALGVERLAKEILWPESRS